MSVTECSEWPSRRPIPSVRPLAGNATQRKLYKSAHKRKLKFEINLTILIKKCKRISIISFKLFAQVEQIYAQRNSILSICSFSQITLHKLTHSTWLSSFWQWCVVGRGGLV